MYELLFKLIVTAQTATVALIGTNSRTTPNAALHNAQRQTRKSDLLHLRFDVGINGAEIGRLICKMTASYPPINGAYCMKQSTLLTNLK